MASAACGSTHQRPAAKGHVRLLAPLAEDLEAWWNVLGSPSDGELVFPRRTVRPWDNVAWRNWGKRIYRPAAINAGLGEGNRPRDLRGSFASLLIWEGQNVVEVAQQLGHSAEMCLRSYAGVFAEFSIEERVSAEQTIRDARRSRDHSVVIHSRVDGDSPRRPVSTS